MAAIYYVVTILCLLLTIVKCSLNIKEINKRIDILEKREQFHQSEERHDKASIETKDLFEEW